MGVTLGLARDAFVLRDVTREDAPVLFAWRRSPRIAAMMLQPPPVDFAAHVAHLERILATPATHALYLLEYRGRKLGHVALKPRAEAAGTGDWSIYVGEPDAPRGTGFALGALALERIVDRPDFRLLRTNILVTNDASRRLHERLMFAQEADAEGCAEKNSEVWSLPAATWVAHRDKVLATAFGAG